MKSKSTNPKSAIHPIAVSTIPVLMFSRKRRWARLNSTKLDQLLHNMGISTLVVCGLTTAICVAQTARECADRGFRVVIASDRCTEMGEEMHIAALEAFSLTFGRTRTTDELLKMFSIETTTKAA